MSGGFSNGGASPKTVTSLANDTRRGLGSPREDAPPGKHSCGTWPGVAHDAGTDMCNCVSWAMARARLTNDNSRGSTPPPPPECRMREWVLVQTVLVHQTTSGLVKQLGINHNARDVRMNSRLPHIPGYSPWRGKLRYVLYSDILRAPMLFMQMS